MVNFVIGTQVASDYEEFLTAELSMEDSDPYGVPELQNVPAAARAKFKVLIVGSGMSGLLAGIRLQEAGIPFEILERHENVGGTWYQNTYPGCRVDSPNHTYSYSFRPNDWPQFYSKQEVLRQYFDKTADDFGLRKHIRFNTEVKTCVYDEAKAMWTRYRRRGRQQETLTANAVISAVGQLNRPQLARPSRAGTSSPASSFHSAQWDHQHDLTGKRVARDRHRRQRLPVRARGRRKQASEAGDLPAHAALGQPDAALPRRACPRASTGCCNHVPYYAKWYRFWLFWRTAEAAAAGAEVDPDWPDQDALGQRGQRQLRQMLTETLEALYADGPTCSRRSLPQYPPAAKRIIVDNGVVGSRRCSRDNVKLITDEIERDHRPTASSPSTASCTRSTC